ncbi:MAG TPA: helix-turn-helix domain-containing protein [Noviherbaspirillum sp.]|nr:helix-turn-helix domain-containing protein [Noviherbaspirillum sp.]
MTQTPPDLDSATRHRHRLLEGMAHAVAAKGYAETTIADIVREAAVSRRTFYEHFATKAECLIALYEAASHNALNVLRDSLNPERDWQEQVEKAMSAYFGCLAQNPMLVRTLFIEILGLGPDGLAARRRVNDEITDFMLTVINRDRKPPLSRDMAMAIIGGINELVLHAIETGRVESLVRLVKSAVELVRAVTQQRG